MDILGMEMEYDFLDADQVEAYERASRKVVEDIKEPSQYEGKSTSDALRIQCRIVDDFFDSLFGAGTAQKLFKGKANIRDHMEAFGTVAQNAMGAKDELEAIQDKYAPGRAGRRQAEKDRQKSQKQNSRNFQYHAAGKGKNSRN